MSNKLFFETQPLSSVFRINTLSVMPNAQPHALWHHHSIPAFDETGRPILELGGNIESNKTEIYNPCVLVSKLNPRKSRVSLVFPIEGDNHCCSTEFICYTPIDDNTVLAFWKHFFGSSYFKKKLTKIAIGSTNSHTRASPKETLGWDVPIVTKKESQKIADILDTLDNQIRETEAMIAKLQQVKQGMLHDMLTRGIDGSGELRPSYKDSPELYKSSELGWIPKDWKVGSIESFLENIIDYRGKTPTKVDLGIRLITAKNVRKGFIQEDPKEFIAEQDYDLWMTRGIPEEKDILFTTEAPLGMVAQIGTTEKLAFAQRLIILQAKSNIDSRFLKQRLLSEQFQNGVLKKASGSTALGIKQSEFRKVVTCFPDTKDEQEAISERVETLEENILNFKIELEKLTIKKAGLMDDLLTGKIRVTDLINQQQAS
ncbi:restriction endonuclease subunit S [Pseudoalteromonas sp. Scap03]|uniref:restriction endonuclease subunit S n=1 Tax=unclassified Pseudoalteromonas TaxID=194690 RepID=UPI0015BBE4B9|nr:MULTISPECIES: restriction endonuclease subunit S [unclassified Pseudoalteromonas]NWL15368.1 restriction endonuclease subunit S [Pseudoalteromonas sp. Scap03]QLE80519.1 restriction endonuclease subunit S [Pseudoalteromonas sp. Scap25]QLE88462.1 restriction endonuclease subunit S [Pseudoalteromonas sp. Scap06]